VLGEIFVDLDVVLDEKLLLVSNGVLFYAIFLCHLPYVFFLSFPLILLLHHVCAFPNFPPII
jgi:hypothetical protein